MITNKVVEEKQVAVETKEPVANQQVAKVKNFFLDPMAKMLSKTKADFSTVNQPEKRYSFNIKDLHKYVKKENESSSN